MLKAIIFDCFGVLTTEGWLPFKDKHFGHDPEKFAAASEIINKTNSGLLSDQDFMQEIAKLAGVSTAEVYEAMRTNVPNEPLFAEIKKLKSRYKIGFLSNIGADYLHDMFSKDQLGLFDTISLSYEIGFVKPDTRAYEAAAQQLDLEPDECVMIDDQARNVNGAREAGMHAILYQSFDQFKADLANIS